MQTALLFSVLVAVSAAALGLLNEGFAVNTLANCGVRFMSCNLYGVKCAVVFVLAVVFALLYRTFDGMVGSLVFHLRYLLFIILS